MGGPASAGPPFLFGARRGYRRAMASDPRSLRALALPRDHGSWSLVLEPVALGLIAAPSMAGLELAVAALALFLLRRPLQIARAGDARSGAAVILVGLLSVVGVAALAAGLGRAGGPAWVALAAALPFAGLFAWFDLRKAARDVAAEVSGAWAFAAFAAAIPLAAGGAAPVAATLAVFAAARAEGSILPIRAYLRRRKGQAVARWPAVAMPVAGTAACVAMGMLSALWLPAGWMALFSARAAWILYGRAPALAATRVGIIEAVLGALAVVTVGLAAR